VGTQKESEPGQDTCTLKGDRADLDTEKKKPGEGGSELVKTKQKNKE